MTKSLEVFAVRLNLHDIKLTKCISVLFIFFVTFGQFDILMKLKISNVIHITLAILIAFYFLDKYKKTSIFGMNALLLLFFTPLFFFLFLPFGSNIFGEVSRFFWFLLIFLFFLYTRTNVLFFKDEAVVVLRFYYFLSLIIIVDSFFYFFLGNSLFPVEFYITPRFSGPFNDPNFLGVIYGLFFCISLYSSKIIRFRKRFLFTSFVCMLLSGSLSALIFALAAVLQTKLIGVRLQSIKPLVCLFVSVTLYPLMYAYSDDIYFIFSKFINFFYSLPENLIEIKYRSLVYRLESVSAAVNLISSNPFGYGYKTLLEYLPRDTHNSFIGTLFEFGFVTSLVFVLVFNFRASSYLSGSLVTFFCLMAMMLNVHYMPMFLFVIFMAFKYRHQYDT